MKLFPQTSDFIDEIFREKLCKTRTPSSASASVQSELSDYIQNHKVSLSGLDFDDDHYSRVTDSDEFEQELRSIYATSVGFETNYSELSDNWLFRKKNLHNRMNDSTSRIVSTTPVGMLVPSPTQDCRTLIGDQNADEISDLSEIESNSDDDVRLEYDQSPAK